MFALLKARGLAVELSAGEGGLSFSGASLFCVNIVLTDAGAPLRLWHSLCPPGLFARPSVSRIPPIGVKGAFDLFIRS